MISDDHYHMYIVQTAMRAEAKNHLSTWYT